MDNSSTVILDSAVKLKQFVIERYQIEYWSEICEEESVEDDRPTKMQDPITRWDAKIAFRGLKDSCPGLDGVRKSL